MERITGIATFLETIMETVLDKPVKKTTYCRSRADEFFATFPTEKISAYKEHWKSIQPQNHGDIFRRYLFSFMSVHTSWKGNVRGYEAIKNYDEWLDDKELLRDKLKNSGVGLYNNRTKYLWAFKDQFWSNPKDYYLTAKKYHIKKRDSIVNKINGLGLAKCAFTLEMIHPLECRAVCLDVHILRLYGMDHLTYGSNKGYNLYRKAEQHWSVNCGKIGVPSAIARAIYWDGIQNQENSRYWTYVFE